jgi:hypothetical protein
LHFKRVTNGLNIAQIPHHRFVAIAARVHYDLRRIIQMNRRQFLLNLASTTIAAVAADKSFAQPAGAANALLTIDETSASHLIPSNYTGLSYELAQLSDPDFFAASNKDLVAFFRLLSPNGVLRLGGNTSETCWFVADSSTTAPSLQLAMRSVSQNWMPHQFYAISPKAIDHLADFLQATSWQLIYGLSLGHSSPQRAATEARYVADVIGPRLLFFQIGNEPDLYSQPYNRTRSAHWGLNDYIQQWLQFADAILKRVPDARFGGPDVTGDSHWIDKFPPIAAKHLGAHFVAVTSHYYAEGPPDDPRMTLARLLRTDPKLEQRAKTIADEAEKLGLQYRMTEGNSCYRGGKPGVSDTLGSALWAADYMLSLARARCAGVNFHGGSRNYLSASLGNHMPGDNATKTPRPAGYYTPIAGDPTTGFTARPIFYGLLLANQFAGAQMVHCSLQSHNVNATAYAAKIRNSLRIAIFNKTDSQDLRVKIETARPLMHAAVWRLTAPSLDATSAPALAGSTIDARGQWAPTHVDALQSSFQGPILQLPHASAAMIFLPSD